MGREPERHLDKSHHVRGRAKRGSGARSTVTRGSRSLPITVQEGVCGAASIIATSTRGEVTGGERVRRRGSRSAAAAEARRAHAEELRAAISAWPSTQPSGAGARRGVNSQVAGARGEVMCEPGQRCRRLIDRNPRPRGRAHRPESGRCDPAADAHRPSLTAEHREARSRRHAPLESRTGGNVQFAVHPTRTSFRVERDEPARCRGRSALDSKATGSRSRSSRPCSRSGFTIDELPNDITGKADGGFERRRYVAVRRALRTREEVPKASAPHWGGDAASASRSEMGRKFAEAFVKRWTAARRVGRVHRPDDAS